LATEHDPPIYSIGAVARMLDIPASTLRAWEERYSLVTPSRSEGSQRLYSRGQVDQLRFLKTQMETGISAADAHRLLSEQLRGGRLAHAPSDGSAGRRPLILIAERDAYAAELAEYFLRTERWDVVIALDATQAKLSFEERSPDVVVLDLLISGGAGFRLLKDFASAETTQVIAVSVLESGDEAIAAGAAAFLSKPVKPLSLASTVRDLLGATPLSDPLSRPLVDR
jgi:DNA-binding transcriptional MerR regulator